MKKESLDRRDFLKKASAAGVGAFAASRGIGPLLAFEGSPNEKMVVGVMGLNGRGMVHAQDFAHGAHTTVGYLCDVDSNVLAKAMSTTTPLQAKAPKAIGDFRRMLEDKNVDAISIAAPDHWHAAATILSLDARKHFYVEKPSGHDEREYEMTAAPARKHPNLPRQPGTPPPADAPLTEVLQLR